MHFSDNHSFKGSIGVTLRIPVRNVQGFFKGSWRVRARWGLGPWGLWGFRASLKLLEVVHTHRLRSSSFLGLPYRILYMNPQKELLWSLWVVVNTEALCSLGQAGG